MEMVLTFDEKYTKLQNEIKNRFSPSNISPKYLRHYICDFIELYTTFNHEKVTKAEIIDLFSSSSLNLAKVDKESVAGLSVAEIDEKIENEVDYLFACLQYRSDIIEEKYPFIISSNSIRIDNTLTYEQKIYLSFLFASNLSVFTEFQSDLTSEFEFFVYCVSKKFFPSQAIIKQFGKNSDYSGNAQSKIRSLGKDLNIVIKDLVDDVIGNQEKGLDIIAWLPFNDKDTNMLTFLFQCACGDGWIHKFSETRRYRGYYDFCKLQPQHVMAISYGLNMQGKFERNDDIIAGESLLFDRLRLMEYIDNQCTQADDLNSIKLIDKIVSTQNINLNF